jgi:transposase
MLFKVILFAYSQNLVSSRRIERACQAQIAFIAFTPQKPIQRAYEQSPTAVKRWMETDDRAIAVRAKKEGAEIH